MSPWGESETALMRAARADHLRVMKALPAQGAGAGEMDAERRSALDHVQEGARGDCRRVYGCMPPLTDAGRVYVRFTWSEGR